MAFQGTVNLNLCSFCFAGVTEEAQEAETHVTGVNSINRTFCLYILCVVLNIVDKKINARSGSALDVKHHHPSIARVLFVSSWVYVHVGSGLLK